MRKLYTSKFTLFLYKANSTKSLHSISEHWEKNNTNPLIETFSIYTGMKQNKLHISTLTYYCRHKNIPVGSHSQKSPTQGDMNDDFNRRWT